MTEVQNEASKVPAVTLLFWIIKIAATTLGETGGDAVTMSMNLGYLVGTGIFAVIFLIAVTIQIKAREFHPVLYWTTIIATTTVGTTLADFALRRREQHPTNPLTGVACGLALHDGVDLGGNGEFPEDRNVLLGNHHVLTDLGYSVRRLDGR